MAVMDNMKNIKDNINFMARNKIEDMGDRKEKLTIDDLKEAVDISYINPYNRIFKEMGFIKEDNGQVLINSFYKETNPFFSKKIKSNSLKNITKKVLSRTTDAIKINDNKEFESIEEVIKGGEQSYSLTIDKKLIDDIAKSILLYDEAIMVQYFEDGQVINKVMDPFRCYLKNNYFMRLFKSGGEEMAEVRFRSESGVYVGQILKLSKNYKENTIVDTFELPFAELGVYRIVTDIEFVCDGLLEHIAMMCDLKSIIHKEIVQSPTEKFIDKGYAPFGRFGMLRENYYPTQPQISDLGEQQKPLFEINQPNIRASELELLNKLIKEEIANIAQIDKVSLGIDVSNETVIGAGLRTSQTEDTINALKQDIEHVINKLLEALGSSQRITIPDYINSDVETKVRIASQARGSRIQTIKAAVTAINTDWTIEQIEEEYLSIMYQEGIPFNSNEEELARKYKIIPEASSEIGAGGEPPAPDGGDNGPIL